MNKQQVVWLIIRLIGLYFAYLALASLFALIGAVPALFTLPKIDADGRSNANVSTPSPAIRVQPIPPDGNLDAADPTAATEKNETLTEKFTAESVKTAAWFFLLTLLYGAAAWYLLRDGRVLFEILNREDPHGLIKERGAEVTTLNLSDKQS